MSDPAFDPNLFGRTGLTPTVGLGIPLYVIHATFTHPVTGAPTSLPPHHWVLIEDLGQTLVSTSKPSDANGVCVVNDVAPLALLADGAFVLGFVPAPADARAFFLKADEAWIDLDSGTWASPQPDRTQIDRRNLYRIPAWTTKRKATRGGGFQAWPANVNPASKASGVFGRDDVLRKPFGSLGQPWEMPIDLGWTLATVRYFYFDWGRDKQNLLPPGLFVDAVLNPPFSDFRVGSGTAVKDGDGAVRMLLEADPSKWLGLQFKFNAPVRTWVDLVVAEPAVGAKDPRLTTGGSLPADPMTRNALPIAWHSLGQRCVAVVKASGNSLRDGWVACSSQLANQAAADVIIDFHLDDVQLAESVSKPIGGLSGHPALFDSFLKLMDPVGNRPHLSQCVVVNSTLFAKDAFAIGKSIASGLNRLQGSTRLVHLDGAFFDLRDDRITGTLGQTASVGARAALKNAHPLVDYAGRKGNPYLASRGFYQIHAIDTPGLKDPVAGVPLTHMLIFISCKIDEGGLPGATIDNFYTLFTDASNRWSQGSPGVPTSTKDYRVVSKDASKRDSVIRVRVYFGQVVVDRSWLLSPGSIASVALKHGDPDDRSHTGHDIFNGGSTTLYDGDINFSMTGSWSGADSDGFSASWNTVAHEFGHALGLIDDYGESITAKTIDKTLPVTGLPAVLSYDQKDEQMPTDTRPFYSDLYSIMNFNCLPRLRHYWHHVEALNRESVFQGLHGAPFLIRHETLGGGLDFVRPVDSGIHPWVPLFADKPIPNGFGKCTLFPVGQDEGVTEAMMRLSGGAPTPLPPSARIDGVLLVRSRVRFRFSDVLPPARWNLIWASFEGALYDGDQLRKAPRFVLAGGGKLARIAVFIQPLCGEGAAPFTSDDFELLISDASPKPPSPDPFDGGKVGDTVSIDIRQFSAQTVLRAILGVSTSTGTPAKANTAPLGLGDLTAVASLVDGELNDGKRVPAFM